MAVPLQVKQVMKHVGDHLFRHQIKPKEDAYGSKHGEYFPIKMLVEVIPAKSGDDIGYTVEMTVDVNGKKYKGSRGWDTLGTNSAITEIGVGETPAVIVDESFNATVEEGKETSPPPAPLEVTTDEPIDIGTLEEGGATTTPAT